MFGMGRYFVGLEDTKLKDSTKLNESVSSTKLHLLAKSIISANDKELSIEELDRPLFK